MSETARTAVCVVAAAALATAAAAWAPARKSPPVFDDQGTLFFPDLQDPVGTPENPAVAAMEVVDFDEATASARPFKVEFRDGMWRIPSHHDYPADAKDRVAKTASGVVGLRRDRVVSDRPQDHESLGVLDPTADSSLPLSGRGKRVTLRDGSGRPLADFIVGKAVPGAEGMRFVRLPDQKRTYAVKVDLDLSARFADWIETDLLRLDRWNLREVVIDGYSVDENAGAIVPGDVLTLRKKDGGADWTLDGIRSGESVDQDKVRPVAETLDDLRIVGVRRKPEGITRGLRAQEGLKLDRAMLGSLQRAGYFMTADGSLVSNEGEVRARTTDGILYTLRFGEVLLGSGDDVSAGSDDGEDGDGQDGAGAGGAKKEGAAGAVENRYLFVTAAFDETAFEKPAPPPAADAPPPPEDGESASAPADDAAAKAREEYDRALAEYTRKVDEAKKKAKDLTDRFADWYYVISADSFRRLRLTRRDLVQGSPDGTDAPPPPPAPPEDGGDGHGPGDGHDHDAGAGGDGDEAPR